jgi:hypothetical protein
MNRRLGSTARAVAFGLGLALVMSMLSAFPALAASGMRAATARVEITPPALGFSSYFRGGYAGLQPITQTSAPLYATGLLIVDSAGARSVVVSADVLAFPASLTVRIQGALQSRHGIPPERVLLVGTHTHTGPVLVDQPNLWTTYGIAAGSPEERLVTSFSDAFVAKVEDLISMLVAAPTQDVVATTGYGLAGGLAFNRASAPLDRAVVSEANIPVLTLRAAATQKVVAVVFSYAMHAVSLHGGHTMWDPDYPGATVDAVESQLGPGVRALFLPGAGGDQDPVGNVGPAQISSVLTPQIVAAVNAVAGTGSAAVSELVAADATDVTLPLDIHADDLTLRAWYANTAQTSPDLTEQRHAQLMVDELDAGTLRRAMTVRVTAWRFAAPAGVKPLAWIAISGEPTIDYSIGFQHILGGGYRPWTIGYTNGHPGYLPSDELLARGDDCPPTCLYRDYEAGWSSVQDGQRYPSAAAAETYNDGLPAPLAPGADNALCRSATALVRGAAADCTGFTPGRLIPHPALADAGPALAQWTGSDGTSHVELFALAANGCLQHRTWTGDANGAATGTWSAWDPASICGGITDASSADAWVDPDANLHIELAVRTTDGSLFHGRCTGDSTGCANRTWQWQSLASTADGFNGPPELSTWKQQDGRIRIDAYATRGPGRCLWHRGWTSTDASGNGSWGAWSDQPGCGSISGPAGAASWRDTTGSLRHDIFVTTSNGAIYTTRCAGTETSCTWTPWTPIATPAGITAAGGPTYSTVQTTTGHLSDLYIRGSDNCVWHAAWTGDTVPSVPDWQQIPGGCVFSPTARPVTVDWQDTFGRIRSTVAAFGDAGGGPIWIGHAYSLPANPNLNTWSGWEDLADPAGGITTP